MSRREERQTRKDRSAVQDKEPVSEMSRKALRKKKWLVGGGIALLVLALTLTLVTAASLDWTDTQLGDLSQYYETGSVGEKNARPGYISTVEGDAGGTSYGIYMFASKAGTPYEFAKWLADHPAGSVYKTMGDILTDAYGMPFSKRHALI